MKEIITLTYSTKNEWIPPIEIPNDKDISLCIQGASDGFNENFIHFQNFQRTLVGQILRVYPQFWLECYQKPFSLLKFVRENYKDAFEITKRVFPKRIQKNQMEQISQELEIDRLKAILQFWKGKENVRSITFSYFDFASFPSEEIDLPNCKTLNFNDVSWVEMDLSSAKLPEVSQMHFESCQGIKSPMFHFPNLIRFQFHCSYYGTYSRNSLLKNPMVRNTIRSWMALLQVFLSKSSNLKDQRKNREVFFRRVFSSTMRKTIKDSKNKSKNPMSFCSFPSLSRSPKLRHLVLTNSNLDWKEQKLEEFTNLKTVHLFASLKFKEDWIKNWKSKPIVFGLQSQFDFEDLLKKQIPKSKLLKVFPDLKVFALPYKYNFSLGKKNGKRPSLRWARKLAEAVGIF